MKKKFVVEMLFGRGPNIVEDDAAWTPRASGNPGQRRRKIVCLEKGWSSAQAQRATLKLQRVSASFRGGQTPKSALSSNRPKAECRRRGRERERKKVLLLFVKKAKFVPFNECMNAFLESQAIVVVVRSALQRTLFKLLSHRK